MKNAWLKLVTTKSTWTLFNPRFSSIATVHANSSWITVPGSLSQRSYALSLETFQIKHLYICVIPSVIPLLQMPTPI